MTTLAPAHPTASLNYQPATFQEFAKLVHDRYTELAKNELFIVGTDSRAVSDAYLAAFPEGTNPIYKTNTEHDCSCCKNFIRHLGNVVAIVDGKMETVWDITNAPYPYDIVAKQMHEYIRSLPITSIFRTTEYSYGAENSVQRLEDGTTKRWNHFHGAVNKKHRTAEPGTAIGGYAASVQVFSRGLTELAPSALQEVLDLIESKALYRGEEHRTVVAEFKRAQIQYNALPADQRELFIWAHAADRYARFRNTVIGTLVQDLSEGVDLESAVKSFESKVAPTNYKRPSALITPGMIKSAMATIKDLDLEPALERRFARMSDVNVNDVLWVNSTSRRLMKGGLEDILMSTVAAPAIRSDATEVSIADFMTKLLPTASAIELMVKNEHNGNLMSLTAPVHASTGRLFKWDNDFAWSYDGNVTDSIKERVKKAGGNVTGDICCRLAWDYKDDLDFHMREPDYHIYFGVRRQLSSNGGVLDLDANGADGTRDDPAENIVYQSRDKMKDGIYKLSVTNYSRRSTDGKGFTVEIEVDGKVHTFNHADTLRTNDTVEVADIVKNGNNILIVPHLRSTSAPREVWGIKTESFVTVNSVMYSPNYWGDNAVGNKHWFFVLDGCKTDTPVRGIYNEFLNSSLEQHRKVFEVLGDKTKCPVTDDQLSGLGFSSTRTESVIARVTSPKGTQTFKINF